MPSVSPTLLRFVSAIIIDWLEGFSKISDAAETGQHLRGHLHSLSAPHLDFIRCSSDIAAGMSKTLHQASPDWFTYSQHHTRGCCRCAFQGDNRWSAHCYEHIRFQVHQFCRERRQFRVAALGRPEEDSKISPLLVSELIHCFNERGRRTRTAYCTAQNAYGRHSSIGWLSSCSGRPCCRSAAYHQGNKLAPSHVTPPGNGLMQGSNYSIIEPPSERPSWQD